MKKKYSQQQRRHKKRVTKRKRSRQRRKQMIGGGDTVGGQYCAPGAPRSSSNTCYDSNTLFEMAQKINQQSQNKINIANLSASQLWKQIETKMSNHCSTERCWAKQLGVSENKFFRPPMPMEWKNNSTAWLSNFDIIDVLKQYEQQHNDFIFLGPSPIDFDTRLKQNQCVEKSLCMLDLKSLARQKKHRVGIVFNLDRHDESGSHWVAMFIHILDGKIYYYDSYGLPPPPEIFALMDRLSYQGQQIQSTYSQLGNNFITHYNQNRHQFKNSECGMYCLFFITSMLARNDFQAFVSNGLNDDQMNQYRQFYFDPTVH